MATHFCRRAAACLVLAWTLPAIGQSTAPLSPRVREAQQYLQQLADGLPAALKASQADLLGDRDPNGPSCIRCMQIGETDKGVPPVMPGDSNGGIGKRMIHWGYWKHDANSPLADYRWHKETLIPYLGRVQSEANAARRALAPLSRSAVFLEAAFALQPEGSWLKGLAPAKTAAATNWPMCCLQSLNEAVAREDTAACERWAGELGSALLSLEDLHRWTEFLATNQLANLRLQEMCKGLFEETQNSFNGPDQEPYAIRGCVSRYPAGSLESAAFSNYMEVERQGEGFFAPPAAWAKAAAESNAVPAAAWMPPDLRAAFVKWRGALGEDNRKVLDRAAAAPYERSFLANMLFRCQEAGTLDPVAVVLSRFDKRFPKADVWQLMDVLPYRGGLGMAGIEWADRYDKRLMEMSGKIEANSGGGALSPREAFFAARRLQYEVYGGSENYKNLVLTLRRALDTHKMDCIRATDLIGALYRNAGFPGFEYVRFSWGVNSHSVAVMEEPNRKPIIVDGLYPPGQEVGEWPDFYFTHHQNVYCVELFGRGLDSCVFLEAYVIHGPSAGTLVKSPVPYLPGRQEESTKKVHSPARPSPELPPRRAPATRPDE